MTSDSSDYHRECSSYASYSLFQFEGSDVISVLKNSTEYSFVFFKCLFWIKYEATILQQGTPFGGKSK